MVAELLGLPSVLLLTSLLSLTIYAVEINHPGEVVYRESRAYGVLGKAVILECGTTIPDMYIWSFTKPGTQAIRAVVYNLGDGPKIQKLAKNLGKLQIISNSAAISIDKLPLTAHGLYTCQAIYMREEPLVVYYYVHLSVRVPVSKPYLVVSDASPQEGSTMWMRCGLDNGTGPIKYVWQHETRNGNLSTFAQSNNNMVNVTDVNRNHTGWYRCLVSNPVNRERSDRIWLDIIFGPDVPRIGVTPFSITERGYSALERETVSLLCEAQSNPPSQYVWFYNNSQVSSEALFTITRILRMHTGDYACLAHNTYLNTRARKSISLTVYYPPDGSPSCSVEPAQNHSSLRLLCSWPGGFPSPSLSWTGQDVDTLGQETDELTNSAILLQSPKTSDNMEFMCTGSHIALKQPTHCSTRTYVPPAEPGCYAYATRNNQYLMLSCSWNGGAPKALVWWEGPGGQGQVAEENSNILVLRYGVARSGHPYTCHAKHPLLIETKTCRLTLEAPVLMTQRSVVSVYEGSDVQLTCILRTNYLPVNEIVWFNNQREEVWDTSSKKYQLQREASWANLTVRDTDGTLDSGQYWCSASNAVGGSEIPVTLLVKRYPMPPNATLASAIYNSRYRTEVELEWETESEEQLTGFILEHRWVAKEAEEEKEDGVSTQAWYRNIIEDPEARSHTVQWLTPTATYQFRVTPVNHRTIGHPSAAKTPAGPSSSSLPAIIGAAIGGMLFAAILTMLLLIFIIRNRNNNPRLHDMLFGSQMSQSRENINYPEDEVVASSDVVIEETASASPGLALPRAASPHAPAPVSITPGSSQAPPTGDDDEPVNVTITVKATGS
ncbi:V-set and immunoglobulin domain-containing protein 10-like 2 [Genypterus blacodes]|uniref:V-set and immunoglobulin domain-containing protein 10-like 2 n=1 Tax=Genypterus blacodes TaxID=154954 RepID=UPI003F77600C